MTLQGGAGNTIQDNYNKIIFGILNKPLGAANRAVFLMFE